MHLLPRNAAALLSTSAPETPPSSTRGSRPAKACAKRLRGQIETVSGSNVRRVRKPEPTATESGSTPIYSGISQSGNSVSGTGGHSGTRTGTRYLQKADMSPRVVIADVRPWRADVPVSYLLAPATRFALESLLAASGQQRRMQDLRRSAGRIEPATLA